HANLFAARFAVGPAPGQVVRDPHRLAAGAALQPDHGRSLPFSSPHPDILIPAGPSSNRNAPFFSPDSWLWPVRNRVPTPAERGWPRAPGSTIRAWGGQWGHLNRPAFPAGAGRPGTAGTGGLGRVPASFLPRGHRDRQPEARRRSLALAARRGAVAGLAPA